MWAGLSGIGLAAGPGGRRRADTSLRLARHLPGQSAHRRGPSFGRPAPPRRVPQPERPRDRHPGHGAVRAGGGVLTYGLIEGGARGWTSPVILGSFAAAVILAAFVAVEARRSAPMLPLRLFGQRLFTVSNTAMVVVGFALMGSSFFFSQFFVYVQGSDRRAPACRPCRYPSPW